MQALGAELCGDDGHSGVDGFSSTAVVVLSTPPSSPRGDSDDPHDGAPIGGKRKRVVVSIHDKQQVLQRLDAGEQPAAIARAYGISRQQVSDIKKNRERILAFCVDAKHVESLRRKTLKATSEYHPGVEQELYRWLVRLRVLGRSVSPDALTNKATELFMQYSAHDASVSFKTITNWLRHFKRAHSLKTLSDDELSKLPDRFVAAMDMTHQAPSASHYTPQHYHQIHQHHIHNQNHTSNGTSSAHFSALLSSMVATPSSTGVTPSGSTTHSNSNNNSSVAMTLGLPLHLATATATTATAPLHLTSMDDYISGMSSVLGLHPATTMTMTTNAVTPQQQQRQQPPIHTGALQQELGDAQRQRLESTVATIQDINAQLALFEREMAAKLDYLDARVEKLCFLVLPQRFD